MPRSTAPAALPPRRRTTTMGIRPRPATDLRHHTTAIHLSRRCHNRLDLTDHLHRRLPRNPTGVSPPGNPRLYGHNTCLQASLRVPISDDWCTEEGGVGGSYLPSAFVGQPVGIDQVDDVWIDDNGATTHMTRNADLMYDTRPLSPHRFMIILGDESLNKLHFVGKLDSVFDSRTDHPVTLHDV